jgi:hypothetical protein
MERGRKVRGREGRSKGDKEAVRSLGKVNFIL